jgi:hypothetical protein
MMNHEPARQRAARGLREPAVKSELVSPGLFVDLGPWQFHLL